jgi:preprotein translocase subunit SecD
MARWLFLAVLLTVGARFGASQERAPGVRRAQYQLEVQLERARALGWAEKGESDGAVVEAAAHIVRRRLEAMQRSFELELDIPRRRIQVSMPQVVARERQLFAELFTSIGVCELLFPPDPENGLGLDLERERAKLATWRAGNPDRPLEAFHSLAPAEGGPHPRLMYVEILDETPRTGFLLLPDRIEDCIGAGAIARVSPVTDAFGYLALAFELKESRQEDLARVTAGHLGQHLGILIVGKLRSAPRIDAKLTTGGEIQGRFTAAEIRDFEKALEKPAGPLTVVESR